MAVKKDYFDRRKKSLISPFEFSEGEGGRAGGQALVLRYWGCNLRCPLCYAWKSSWLPLSQGASYDVGMSAAALHSLCTEAKGKKIVWIRIQGGEPCLSYDRTLNTLSFAAKALALVNKYRLNRFDTTRAVIQTNGISFSKMKRNELANLMNHLGKLLDTVGPGRVVFEVSFKSPNQQPILQKQIDGYNALLNAVVVPLWQIGITNIAVYPIAGLGPAVDNHDKWLIPVDSTLLPSEIPLFHRNTWAPDFSNLIRYFIQQVVPNVSAYADFRCNPRTNNGTKIAIEELEPTGNFQTSWISGYAGAYSRQGVKKVTSLNRLLRKSSTKPSEQWQALFFRYPHWIAVLNQIPISNNPAQLTTYVAGMVTDFYPSHPVGHYPYL